MLQSGWQAYIIWQIDEHWPVFGLEIFSPQVFAMGVSQ
jgi:hypothetical protein